MTALLPPPLAGFNNNFRYRGLNFHIQTEDSGVGRPHVITHLFADGGRVIKTLRVDYSEHVEGPDCRVVVQRMMRDQHRAMAYELRQGRVDAIIDGLIAAQKLAGTEDAAHSLSMLASAGGSSERQQSAPELSAEAKPPTEAASGVRVVDDEKALPQSSSRPHRVSDSMAALALSKHRADFSALPPPSLDELILRYVSRVRR